MLMICFPEQSQRSPSVNLNDAKDSSRQEADTENHDSD